MPKIIAWGARSEFQTGQQIVTDAAVEILKSKFAGTVSYEYPAGRIKSLFEYLGSIFLSLKDLSSSESCIFYFAPSRSTVGFLRDLPILLLAKRNAKLLAHVHGSDVLDLFSARWYSPFARWSYRGVDLIVPSTHLKDALSSVFGGRVILCENFVRRTSEKLLKQSGESARLVHSGVIQRGLPITIWNSNIMGTKGFVEFAESIKKLNQNRTKTIVVVLGKPIGDPELSTAGADALLDSLLIFDWFYYLGPVEPSVASSLVDEADICVLPSRRECQPLSLVEAMCSGCAIVASDDAGVLATLGDYPAEVVDTYSFQELFDAMERTVNAVGEHPQEFKKQFSNERDRARTRFSYERFEQRLTEIVNTSARNM